MSAHEHKYEEKEGRWVCKHCGAPFDLAEMMFSDARLVSRPKKEEHK